MQHSYASINFSEKFSHIHEWWTPKILAAFDHYYVKAAKMKGEFVWHTHEDVDELFIVVPGTLKILFRDGEVTVAEGECFVVLCGTEHKPVADEEVCCLLLEKACTLNTGDAGGERTVASEEWI